MPNTDLWLASSSAFFVSFFCSRLAILAGTRSGHGLDRPNHRSLHSQPIPRLGGIGIMLGIAVGGGIGGIQEEFQLLGIPVGLLAILSLLDDLKGLSIGWRFAGHAAAGVFLVVVAAPNLAWPAMLLITVACIWVINLYNFMDGSDGLAGGMACIGFGWLAWAAFTAEAWPLATTCMIIVAASIGFLLLNAPPAKIFMGDSGSIPLGFLVAAVSITGWRTNVWPLWFPIAAFLPFVADASVTLLKRAIRRDRVWQPHREHYYQRLVRMGWSHRRLMCAEYLLMVFTGGIATLALNTAPSIWLATLGGLVCLYLLLARFIDKQWIKHETARLGHV